VTTQRPTTLSTSEAPNATRKPSEPGIVAKRTGDESESKGLSGGVIAGIVLVLVFLIALVLVGIWYVRHRTRYYGGKSISYYKDMTTKPLEEDFDDEEAAKVFDHRGSREKVEFA